MSTGMLNTKRRTYNKHEHLLEEGNSSARAWYLEKGLLRMYYMREEHEVTMVFNMEGMWVFEPGSFFTKEKATLSIEALEHCSTLSMDQGEMMYLLERDAAFARNRLLFAEWYAAQLSLRIRATSMLHPEEKYEYFTKHFPDLLGRISLDVMSSYLDMNKRTLTRIRAGRVCK